MLNEPFLLAEWTVDPATGSITRDGECTKLEPRAMTLLVYLASHPGKVLSRRELDEQVWSGMVVSDDALTSTITRLRKAFADDYHNPRFIRTIPKKGYQLIAEVRQDPHPSEFSPKEKTTEAVSLSPAFSSDMLRFLKLKRRLPTNRVAWAIIAVVTMTLLTMGIQRSFNSNSENNSALQLPDMPSIAVLPLSNIGQDPAQEYFSEGFSEDIITTLSRVPELFIIARNSAFKYQSNNVNIPAVADKLGVRFVLHGSVQKQQSRVRINLHLADNQSRRTIWAERYDGTTEDLFLLQDRVASDTLEAIRLQLGTNALQLKNRTAPVNIEAYDEFLKGWQLVWLYSREGYAKAEAHFKKAIELDPDYSRSYAALALIYWNAWKLKWHENSANPYATWVLANKALKKSMLQPNALAYSTKSAMHLHNKRYEEAIVLARQAIDINANSAFAYLTLANALAFDGQSELAIQSAEKGIRLDPEFPNSYLSIKGRALFDQGNLRQAEKILVHSALANPRDSDSRVVLLACYGHLNQLEEAAYVLAELNLEQKRQDLRPFSIDWLRNRWPYRESEKLDYLIEGLKKAQVPAR